MKTFRTILLATLLILTGGCTEENKTLSFSDKLNGSWNLSSLSGGFAGVDFDFSEGEVIWDYNSNTMMVSVTSNLDADDMRSSFLPLQEGEYEFSINESGGNTFLVIDGAGIYENNEFGKIDLNNSTLTIDQGQGSNGGADDVYVLILTK
ncbi:MAG: hypothetical protein HKO96_00410 [Flavobacteriaceae bacterium]|nr:hypothetical protein [Bacteroidia bacterium]NNF82317.1 hypothetical protein [Flavobacteriaceae bacterium]NNK68908.1 hypothetical protein [Flavobacteriaceae bacterium]NNL81521.1 hypothetical protein [Flavobacteriaceae bacterium]